MPLKLNIRAVGTRMPEWVTHGYQEYAKRLPRHYPLTLQEIPLAKRTRTSNLQQCKTQEGEQLLKHIDRPSTIVALEVTGKAWDTPTLATHLQNWHDQGDNVYFMIGGPDGLAEACSSAAHHHWSLSPLTLPHPLVRLIVAEQLYRAWSILANHPYHRE